MTLWRSRHGQQNPTPRPLTGYKSVENPKTGETTMRRAKITKYAIRRTPLRRGLALLAAFAMAASLSESDKRGGLTLLDRTRSGVVAATKGLSEAQWKFKSAPSRWSVAEVMEHIALSEDMLFENTSRKVMQAPAGNEERDYKNIDKLVLSAIADRSQKAQAPEPLIPTGRP